MSHTAHPLTVDPARCTGCGLCAAVCPSEILSVRGDAVHVGAGAGACLECGHCQAACPEAAIRVDSADPAALAFATCEPGETLLRPGKADPAQLVRLMRSRRSCRHYAEAPVPEPLLEDLVRAAVTAPSGTNSQRWTFTLLPGRAAVLRLGEAVGDSFRALNRLAEKAWLRGLLRLAGRPQLADYHAGYQARVEDALRRWDDERADLLFHGAPAVVVVGSRPGASCPAEDALLATQNLLLFAHASGLGACLVGYAVEAMRRDKSIQRAIGMPDEETVHAVAAVGWPVETYMRPAPRKTPLVRWFRPDMGAGAEAS